MIQYKARQPLFYSKKEIPSNIIKVQHVCTFIEKNILIYLIKKNIMCVANYAREIKLDFFCIKITDLTITDFF